MTADRAGSAATPQDLMAEALLGCSLTPVADTFSIEALAANGGPVSLTLPGHALHHVIVSLLGLLGRRQALLREDGPIVLQVTQARREGVGLSDHELLTLTTTAGAEISFLLNQQTLGRIPEAAETGSEDRILH